MKLLCPVASEVWLKHLLMVLGIHAEIQELPEGIDGNIRSKMAKEILMTYTG